MYASSSGNNSSYLGTLSNALTLASALRAYFRYRTTCRDRVHGLLGVLVSPAQWSLASLPRALKPAEVEHLLASFTASLQSPRRGYAIVRCALDMGLRSSEVAKLQLADIDWRAGTVMLNRTKSRRQDILPLPAVTGQALADYVRHERPKATNPAVFVRCLAPRDQPIDVDAPCGAWSVMPTGASAWHTAARMRCATVACRLLERGSSIKEVADVLRHRSLNTSLIYAKLDAPRLAAVALPWPRGRDMSARTDLQARGDDYLAERRRVGFKMRNSCHTLSSFARYADGVAHPGPLTVEHMAERARLDKRNRGTPATWARRLKQLRPFLRWLRQFEPRTEVPDESVFGSMSGRMAPHIYREDEIVALLAAARRLHPRGGLRPAIFGTLFGLIASAGLRVSEALGLLDAVVDLTAGTLTVQWTKFAQSRLLALHPSTVEALAR